MRRLKRLIISNAILESWFKGERPEIAPLAARLPVDARIVDAKIAAFHRLWVEFVVESGEFEPVPEGEPIPELRIPAPDSADVAPC